MDPEIVERLNEQLREMFEILSEQNTMMASQMKAMKDQTAATDKSTKAKDKQGKATDKLADSTDGLTKKQEAYARAEQERQEAVQEATDRINKAMGTVANGFLSLGSVIMDSTHSFSKYNGMIGTAGDAALDLGKNFGVLGTVIGGVVKAATMLMQYQLTQSDSLLKFNDQISKMGAANSFNTDEILSMANKIGFAAKDLDKLMAPMQKLGSTFKQIGTNADDSTRRFMEMANVGSDVRQEFQRLGYSQSELVEAQAGYIELMGGAGLALRSFGGDMKTLKTVSLDYVKNLQVLSELSGQSAEAQQQQMAAAAADMQFQIYAAEQNKKIEAATSEDEKKRLQEQFQLVLATKEMLNRTQGADVARAYGQGVAGGPMTQGLGQMAVSGTLGEVQQLARLGRQDQMTEQQLASSQDFIAKRVTDTITGPLKTAFLVNADAANELAGGYKAAAEANRLTGYDAEAAAKKARDAIEANEKGTGPAAEDDRQQLRNTLTETEIALRTAFDSFAGNLGIASTALIGLAGAAGLAGLALAARGALGKLAGGAAGAGAAGAGAAGAAGAGAAGAAGAGAAGAGAAGAGAAGATAAGGAAAAGKGAKVLQAAKGAAIVAGGAYVIDAGFGAAGVGKDLDSKKIQSQDDKNWERASTWEKTQSSLARGIEHIGRFMFMDNLANQAQADRVKSETEYLDKKLGAETGSKNAAKTTAATTAAATVDSKFADAFGKHVDKFGDIVNKLGSTNKGMSSSSVATSFGKNIESFGKIVIAFAKTVTAFAKIIKTFATVTGTFAKAAKMFADQNKSLTSPGTIGGLTKGKSTGLLGTSTEVDSELDVVDYIERLKTSLADTALSTDNLREAELKRHRFTEESMMQFRRSLTDASKILNKISGINEEETDDSSSSGGGDSSSNDSNNNNNNSSSSSSDDSAAAAPTGGASAAMDYFQKQGYTKQQAAGIVGNLQQESGQGLDPGAENASGHYGIAQWDKSRRKKFEKVMGKSIYGSSLEDQLEFIKYELDKGNGGKQLRSAKTAEEAAIIFEQKYERSGGSAMGQRIKNAKALESASDRGASNSKGMTTITAQGKSATVAAEVAPKFQSLLDAMTKSRYKIKSLGGYSDRNVAGTGAKSAHSRGWAIDVNPGANPMGNRLITDMPKSVVNHARSIGLGWGGDWRSKKDAMHFSAQENEGGYLQARKGGLVKGPDSGYPVEMHGSEMITPLTQDSILAKLAKTPAETPEISNAISSTAPTMEKEILERVVNMNSELVEGMLSKLGDMVSALADGNDTREKILKNSMV